MRRELRTLKANEALRKAHEKLREETDYSYMFETDQKKEPTKEDPFHEPQTNWSLFAVITILILILIMVGAIMFGIAECMIRRGKRMEFLEVESMVAMDANSQGSAEHEML